MGKGEQVLMIFCWEKETGFLLLGERNRVSAVGVKKPGFCCEYHQLSVGSEKETRFLGFWVSGGGCWGKETGFLLWISSVICEMRKRNPISEFLGVSGFLLLGQRNRVSVVGIRSYLWDAKKKPGFWVSGFLLLGERNRVSVVGIRSYLWVAKKKPGFWGDRFADTVFY